MPNLAAALRDEIRRLARKEVRAHATPLKQAVAQYRREIARLKRQNRIHERQIKNLESRERGRNETVAASASVSDGLRFSARSVRAQRKRLGLSAADYGKLVGVSSLTVYNWENGKSRPRKGQFAALVAVRGIGKREALARLEAQATPRKKPGRPRRRK